MLTVTPAAIDRLSQKLARRKAADDVALRFIRRPGGWKLRPDRARPADTAFTRDGRSVLLLDATVAEAMTDMALEVQKTKSGPRLRLRRIADGED